MRSDFYAKTVMRQVRDASMKAEGRERDAVLVDANSVARMVFEREQEELPKWGEMPCNRPPWELTWVEYAMPSAIRTGGSLVTSVFPGARVAFFVVCEPLIGVHGVDSGLSAVTREHPEAVAEFMKDADMEGVVVYAHAFLWPRDQPHPYQKHSTCYYLLDRHGVFKGNMLFGGVDGIDGVGEGGLLGSRDAGIIWFKGAYAVIQELFALCHCKNIEVTDSLPPPKVARARERKGEPVITYKTLVLHPMRPQMRREGQVGGEGSKRSFHIRRGHFKTYTKERPLFGRVSGTFWVDQHAAGNLKHGRVVKDYRVEPPEGGNWR